MVTRGRSRPPWFYTQSGAVPVRRTGDAVEILLVTSRGRRRWIIPKGIVEPGLSPADSAAKEAWEEAGVGGALGAEPLGSYAYEKWGGTCTVTVFPLEVDQVAEVWPEADRERRWFDAEEAASLVEEPELREILRWAARRIGRGER